MTALPPNKSAAGERYDYNVERLIKLVTVVSEAWRIIGTELDRLRAAATDAKPGDETDRELDRLIIRAEEQSAAGRFAFEWYAVMMVTFVETYIEDVLSSSAEIDPSLMEKSDQRAGYAEVRTAHSLADLLDEMRRRWAKNFIEDGGPARWADRFGRMGAEHFEPQSVDALEELWGIRHVVVHCAGRTTPDFCKRHPTLGYKKGEQLDVSKDAILNYLRAARSFVVVVERYFIARYPALGH